MKTKNIELNGKDYKIEALPLGKYAQLLSALETIPEHISGIDELNEEQLLKKLPEMIATSFPELVEILSLASGIEPKVLKEDMTLTDAVELVEAIFEVNEFDRLGKAIGRIRGKVKTKTQKTG